MNVEIIAPDKEIFSGTASLVQLPGIDGSFQIMNNHAPIIAALQKGKIKLVSDSETSFFEINGGVVEVINNTVQVLAE